MCPKSINQETFEMFWGVIDAYQWKIEETGGDIMFPTG